jgi:hypothetical protein
VAIPLVADCIRDEHAFRISRLNKNTMVVVLFTFKIGGTGWFQKGGL